MRRKITDLESVESKIYLIRGRKVILDVDLAALYQVTTSNLNKAVNRNLSRFPSDFMFRLTAEEAEPLKFQIGMSKVKGRGGRRTLPLAFTQEGVAMLSSVLRTEEAVRVNILIMRAFVRLKEMAIGHEDLSRRIDQLEERYDQQFTSVFDAIRELLSEHSVPRKRVIGLGKKEERP